MKNLEEISPKQSIFLLGISRISIVLLWFHFSNQDVWITEIIALLYVAVLCAPLLFLSSVFANLTIIEYLPIIMGQLVGKILGALYVIFFLFFAILDLSLFDNIIKPINLPETPDSAIILLALATCTYAVYKGLECIARSAEFFTLPILIIVVVYAVLQIPEMDFKVFLPIFSDSTFLEINFLAFMTAARIHEIIVLAMLAPAINKKKSTKRIFFWIAILVTIFSMLIIVTTLAGLGQEVAKKTFDPYYLFIKQINIYDFITRIEFLIVAAWNIGMFLKISLFIYLANISLVQIVGLEKRKSLIIPIDIVIFVIALKTEVLKSVIVFEIMEKYVPYINLVFTLGIPGVMLLVLFLKKINAKSYCKS